MSAHLQHYGEGAPSTPCHCPWRPGEYGEKGHFCAPWNKGDGMSEIRLIQSRAGTTNGIRITRGRVPTGPHSDGPMGVLTTTNRGKGDRSASRQAAADALGKTYGRVKVIANVSGMNLSGVRETRLWWL